MLAAALNACWLLASEDGITTVKPKSSRSGRQIWVEGPPIRRLVQTRLVIHMVGAPSWTSTFTPRRGMCPGIRGNSSDRRRLPKLEDIWAIRVRLQIQNRTRELALFNLAIDSKLRSCDLVKLRVRDVCHGSIVATRSMVMQQKTQRPVQFEITEQTREALLAWIRIANRRSDDYLFPTRLHGSPHLSTRQYAQNRWWLGSRDRSRLKRVRNPHDATY
jgi:hypothetical protein